MSWISRAGNMRNTFTPLGKNRTIRRGWPSQVHLYLVYIYVYTCTCTVNIHVTWHEFQHVWTRTIAIAIDIPLVWTLSWLSARFILSMESSTPTNPGGKCVYLVWHSEANANGTGTSRTLTLEDLEVWFCPLPEC